MNVSANDALRVVFVSLAMLSGTSAQATAATAITVACSSSNKVQTKINAAAAGIVTVINVSGNCNENIDVPSGKTIYLVGTGGNQAATITAKDVTKPAVYSQGVLQITNMTVRSLTGTSPTVQATVGGTVALMGDLVTSASAPQVIQAFKNSNIVIGNSRVTNTAAADKQNKTIGVDQSSSLTVYGDSTFAIGPDGFITTVSGAKDAIYCGGGSSATLLASGTGKIFVGNSNRGINLNACSLTIENQTDTASNLQISNNAAVGIISYNSDVMLSKLLIAKNGTGLNSFVSRSVIVGATFGGPIGGNTRDIKADLNSTVDIDDWGGQTSFLSLSETSFICGNGGVIYYAPPYVAQSLLDYEGGCLKAAQ